MVTNTFKQNIQKYGREISGRISFDNVVLEADDIVSIEKTFDADFMRTVMQEINCEINGRYDLTDKRVKVELGVGYNGSVKEYVNFGWFNVVEHTRNVVADGNDTTKFKAFDDMIKAHDIFEVDKLLVIYPLAITELINKISLYMGLEVILDGANLDKIIEEEKWEKIDNTTYRNILDEIAQTTGTTIVINDGKLLMKPFSSIPVAVGVINEDDLFSLELKKKYGPVNILNLTRDATNDNYPYPLNWETIPKDDRVEIAIFSNQIMDKRRSDYAPDLFTKISSIEYYPFEADTQGFAYFKPMDIVNVVDMNGINHLSFIGQSQIKIGADVSEKLITLKPELNKEQYVVITDNQRRLHRTEILVDKQAQEIEIVTQRTDSVETKLSSVELDLDSVTTTVAENVIDIEGNKSNITVVEQKIDSFQFTVSNANGLNMLKNSIMFNDQAFWNSTALDEKGELIYPELGGIESGINTWALLQASKYAMFGNGIDCQEIELNGNTRYSLSFSFNKQTASGTLKIFYILDNVRTDVFTQTAVEQGKFSTSITTTSNTKISIGLEMTGINLDSPTYVSDLIITKGEIFEWSPAIGETYTLNVLIDGTGIKVKSLDNNAYTSMTPYEFAHYYNNEKVFNMNRFEAQFADLLVKGSTFELQNALRFINDRENNRIVMVNMLGSEN